MASSEPSISAPATNPRTTRTSSWRILVVDDEEGMREWLAEVLQSAGHQVFTARDGLEAKSLAKRQALELVITDISMPNEEGLGTIRFLRKMHPDVKIIALSGVDPEVLQDAKILGANAALTKPVTMKMLLKCLRNLS
jgi:DNA-binding response OmpR family regulator